MRDDARAAAPSPRGHWAALAALIAPFRRRLIALGALAAVGATLPLAGPLLLRAFVDRAVAGDSTSQLLVPATAYVIIAVISQIMAVVVLWAATRVTWTVTDAARVELTDHILRHGLEFHHQHAPGELVERVDGDLTAVSDHLATFVVTLISVVFTMGGMLIVVTLIDWRIAILTGLYVAGAAWNFATLRDRAVNDASLERGAIAQMYGRVEEQLVGVDDIRANGAGSYAMERFEHDAEQVLDASIRRERAIVWLWHGATITVVGGVIAALALGAVGTSLGWISVGTAFLLFQYTQLVQQPLDQMVEQLQEVQKAAGGMLRVRTLLDDEPQEPPSTGPNVPAGPLAITFTGVYFSYGDEAVLQGIDLHLEAGRSLGIVGATGGGKTTLGRLLTRTLSPGQGTITLGGVDLARIAEPDLRRLIGVVPQDVEIFSTSIRDNVSLFDRAASDQSIRDALEQVGLASKLLSHSDGLDHELVGESAELSAGEAQLLALSRVFLRDPAIVLLDEATSRVDPETEQQVLESIGRLVHGRTSVVIAHRLATLERVDEIAVLRDGTVVEHGDRLALLADDGMYAQLVELTSRTVGNP